MKAASYLLFSLAVILALLVLADLVSGVSTVPSSRGLHPITADRENHPQEFAELIFFKCWMIVICAIFGAVLQWGVSLEKKIDTISGE